MLTINNAYSSYVLDVSLYQVYVCCLQRHVTSTTEDNLDKKIMIYFNFIEIASDVYLNITKLTATTKDYSSLQKNNQY